MSLKLLKQSVDIVQEESINQSDQIKKGKQLNRSNKQIHSKTWEHQKRHKKNLKDVRSELKTISKKSEENIKRLLALSMNTVNIKDAEKIVQRAHKGRYVEKIIPKVEKESIFTEEDFRKFEEEYFNS